MARMRYLQALAKALADEMERDDRIVVFGEDVRSSLRGVTAGLHDRFGSHRVVDMPISEAGFTGLATGAALDGMRPVVEYQIPALLYVAFDQIINQAQKIRLMTGGQASVPVTYLIPGSGARQGLAGQHSDNPYALLAQAGVKTVLPAAADDAYGLLISALRDDDPVALFAPAALLGQRADVPETAHEVPIGTGRVWREGRDVTVLATGHLVPVSLRVADALAEEGIEAEVVDPRSILPFDRRLLADSVSKTGRLVVIDDTNRSCGFGAEVAARAAEECWHSLSAPIIRLTRADMAVPFAPCLEAEVVPSAWRLEEAIRRLAEVAA